MSIGSTIKKLRRERDMTQEQLAEYLGITANAVSQWECDRTAPDISQLPMLAYVLDVSTDEILGVNTYKQDESVKKIIDEQKEFYAAGNFLKSSVILKKGLALYPKSYEIMVTLAHVLSCMGDVKETEVLCLKVLEECTDNEIRDKAFQDLIFSYNNSGKTDEAIKYAKKMSHTWVSQEEMMLSLLSGKEAIDHRIDYIKFCSNRLIMSLNYLAKQTDIDINDRIAIAKQAAAIPEILYPDEDYHYVACLALRSYEILANLYAGKKDIEETLNALEKMSKFAIHFDNYDPEAVNTSPAVKNYKDGGWIPDPQGNRSWFILNKVQNENNYDFVRSEQRYINVIEKLEKNAVKNTI